MYVKNALKGQKLEKNKTVAITVPRRNEIVKETLSALESDLKELEKSSLSELESDIDDIVFDLYGIDSEEEREVIRRYNNQYDKIQKIVPN